MAELTVDGLGELTSPAANDEIGIWDVSAGQYLKIRRDTLVGGTITGDGTVATGGYTLTVPATGTAALVSRGTWTPGISADGTAPTPTFSYQLGWYERIGNLVHVSFLVETTAISGGSGNLLITNLPFTHKTAAGGAATGVCSMKLDWSASKTFVIANINANTNYISFLEHQDNTAPSLLPLAAWGATSFVQGSIVYLTE